MIRLRATLKSVDCLNCLKQLISAEVGFHWMINERMWKDVLQIQIMNSGDRVYDLVDDLADLRPCFFQQYLFFVDKSTIVHSGPGRPRLYKSNAERQASYRRRNMPKTLYESERPSKRQRLTTPEASEASEVSKVRSGFDIFGIQSYDTRLVVVDWSTVCNSLGVFARSDIDAGTFLTAYEGDLLSFQQASCLQPWQKTHLRSISLSDESEVIDGLRLPTSLSGVASLINSSRFGSVAPNAFFSLASDQEKKISAISAKKIKAGEEIFCDYSWDEWLFNSIPQRTMMFSNTNVMSRVACNGLLAWLTAQKLTMTLLAGSVHIL